MEDTRIKSSSSVCKANALPMVLSLWPLHHRFPSAGARTQHFREFLRELKTQVSRKNPSLLEKESGFDLHDCPRPFSAPKEEFQEGDRGCKRTSLSKHEGRGRHVFKDKVDLSSGDSV